MTYIGFYVESHLAFHLQHIWKLDVAPTRFLEQNDVLHSTIHVQIYGFSIIPVHECVMVVSI